MTVEDGFDNSPISSKSNYFPFLSSTDSNTQRKPKVIRKLTKTLSNLSITPTRQSQKSSYKGKSVGNNTRTPSIASFDSEFYHSSAVTGKMTLRVLNPDPENSSDDDDQGTDSTPATTTITDHHVTPAQSILTQNNMIIGATSNSTHPHIPSTNVLHAPISESPTSLEDLEQQPPSIPTTPVTPKLVRRQSKTLNEFVSGNSPGFLPPLDLTPFDSSHFIPPSNESSRLSSHYIRLSTTIEPAPALATPVNATPTATQSLVLAFNAPPEPPQPEPSVSNTTRGDKSSLASFDRNTLTTLPGDSKPSDRRPSLPHSLFNNGAATSPNGNGSVYGKFTASPTPSASKYAKASYSLTNHPDALQLYRDMAKKTGDKTVQYSYAKYLLEVAALYDHGRETKYGGPLSSIKHSLGDASQRLRHELGQITKSGTNSARNGPSSTYAPSTTATTTFGSRSSVDFSATQSTYTTTTTTVSPSFVRPRSSTTSSIDSQSPPPSTVKTTERYLPTNYKRSTRENNNTSHQRKKRALEEEGIHWMKRLAKEHMPDAAYTVATWMDESKYGFTPHAGKSFVLYQVAADAGIRDAVYKMGLYYASIGDSSNALAFIKKASDLGVVHATLRLAKIYLHGEFSERQNMTLALRLLHQATNDADTSCPEPPYMFGQILTNTYPYAEIPSQVVEQYGGVLSSLPYFEKAVQLGYPPAHSTLGSILEQGLYGLRVNYAQCNLHYTEAAKRGDALGMLGLSRLYNRGSYGPGEHRDSLMQRLALDESGWLAQRASNEEKAFYWCQKAADQGLPEAEFLLGWYHEIGLGTPRDLAQSQRFYHKAASSGHQEAKQRLAKDTTVDGATPTSPIPKRESQQCVLM